MSVFVFLGIALSAGGLLGAEEVPADRVPLDRVALEADWALQDGLVQDGRLDIEVVRRVVTSLARTPRDLRQELAELTSAADPDDPRWEMLYHAACQERRLERLEPYQDAIRRVVFTKHFNFGGSHYAYTENLTDTQHVEAARTNPDYRMGASLCLLEVASDGTTAYRTLFEAPSGVIRDPDVSHDATRILFAMRRSPDRDDYHLYEMDVATAEVRQLTFGEAVADYEGQYLPNGHLVFNSSRPVQIVDCFWTEVSNLYTCDADGKYLRRLSFDQVHTNFPTVTPDGRVLYTRWDYSDRGQVYPQGLFQMTPEGTGQTEVYGNNSWFPTAILHARAIPGTSRVVAIFSGHHSHQRGQLGILDPSLGRQENEGAQLIAPERDTPADRVDAYGQSGPQFQYPYPLDERTFLVTMDPIGSPGKKYNRPYGIYWLDASGRRELLAADPEISCNQPIPLRPRSRPHLRPGTVDYTKSTGTYYVQDVYAGQGLAGVPRGTIKKLRAITFTTRVAGIRCNHSRGPAGGALASTPVSIGNGCWDPKIILGDATVHEDGSACFQVPARMPIYFQALDENGHAVQSMRSWSTLQPGEAFACTGCHGSKNGSPWPKSSSLAMRHGPERLEPFYGPARGFSFAAEVQPVFDEHCTRCHDDRTRRIDWDRSLETPVPDVGKAFSLLGTTTTEKQSGRRWSDAYLALTGVKIEDAANPKARAFTGRPNRLVRWIAVQEGPTMLPPYNAGATQSGLIPLLKSGHGGVELDRESMDKIVAWIDLLVPYCGDYAEANAWTAEELQKHQHFTEKRRRQEILERENVAAWIRDQRHASEGISP